MSALFSSSPKSPDGIARDCMVPHSAEVSSSHSAVTVVGQVRHSHIEAEWLQDLLAYAARCPLLVRDIAGGIAHESLDGVFKIPITNAAGVFALIDAEDYPLVRRLRWRLQAGRTGYVFASDQAGSASAVPVFLHRLILMVGKSVQVDHRGGNRLDNRKSKLRACTQTQNCWNAVTPQHNTSGVKGVFWHKGQRRWIGQVVSSGVRHAKRFLEMADAVAWVRAKRIEVHGDFACHGARELDDGADYFQVQGRLWLERRQA